MRTKPLRFLWLLLAAIGLLGQTGIQARTFSYTNPNPGLLKTVAPPNITTQPVSQTVCSTSPASFSVAATNATGYRWQVSYDNTFNFPSNLGNTGVYSGADTPVLTISSVENLNGSYFRCVVTNGGESTNSDGVLLTVTTLPTATIFYSNPLFCSLDGNQTGINRSGIGGTGGTYSSSPSSLSLTSNFGQVTPGSSTPGSYTVTYTIPARGGCPVVTATTTLTITAAPTITGNAVIQPTCATPTGTISVTATGSGTIEYSRNGSDWQTSGSFSELAPGEYTIRVRSSDNLTCGRNITFTLNAATAPVVSNPTVTTASTGSAFSQNFTVPGGTGPYSYSLASGTLPTGLTLATTGILSGTPTQGGNFTITVRATGSNGCSGVGPSYVLDVTAIPAVVINTGPVSQSVCSTNPASFSVDATNATTYQWQRSADNTFNFPSILSNSGVYSGTDTPVLTISSISGMTGYYFRCVVSNSGGSVNSNGAMLTVTTLPTATIFYSSPLLCTVGGSQGLVTRSGNNSNGGVYSSNPSSLSITSNTGIVTPGSSTPGSYTVTYTVAASGGCPVVTATTTLTVTAPPTSAGSSTTQPTCAIPTGTISVTATGSGTIDYSRNGTDWQSSGFFSGLDPGSYVIRLRSSDNPTCTRNLGFTINAVPAGPTVSNPAVTTATVGAGFSRNFTAASGMTPYSYSVASGSLPNGVTLSTTGVLSGTATESGSFTITVRATGSNGCSGVGSAYILTVGDAPSADLFINKTDGVASVIPGVPTTYTITVGNAGPQAVTGATVTDIFPVSITSVAWTATFSGGASGTASGTGNINQSVAMPVGSSVTYQAVCATNPASTGMLTNTATVTSPGGITDPNPDNSSATDVNALTPEADLTFSLSGSPNPVAAGNRLTYTGQASNNGPSTAGSVQVSIPLSTSITFFSLSAPGGWSCTTPSVGTTGTVSCSQASFPTGGTASFTLVVTTAPGSAGSTLITSATISSGTTDGNPNNNGASVNTPIVSGNANLSNLTLNPGSLSTAFFASVVNYSATVGNSTSNLTVTPTAENSNATILVRVNGGSYSPVTSGTASDPLALTVGTNPIDVQVTAEDGVTTKTYQIIVTRGIETPLISTQPVSQTVCSSSPVSFSVSAENATSYRWQRSNDNTFNFPSNLGNSGVYSGADTPMLTISSVSGLDGQYFRCVVSNEGGSTNSDAIRLTVTTLPTAVISYNNTVFCNNTDAVGLVTRSGIGGNGGTYSSNPSSLSINPSSGTVIPAYSPAGSYTITYTVPASSGCPVVTATTALTVVAPPTLTGSTVTHPTCTTSTGIISLSATGSGTIEYSRNGTDWQSSGTFSNLDPGSYVIQVRSSINPTCTLNLTFSINEIPSAPSAVITPSSATLTCASPALSLTASGGSTYRWEDSSTNPIRAITSAGTYSVTVTAGNGCTAAANVVIEEDRQAPSAVISPSSATLTCASPALSLTASGGSTYRWEDSSTNPMRTITSAGTYSVTVTAGNGCTAAANVVIE
ncbi:beta strand repeat-containing protein, partial [Larkinella rosea]